MFPTVAASLSQVHISQGEFKGDLSQ